MFWVIDRRGMSSGGPAVRQLSPIMVIKLYNKSCDHTSGVFALLIWCCQFPLNFAGWRGGTIGEVRSHH